MQTYVFVLSSVVYNIQNSNIVNWRIKINALHYLQFDVKF